MTETDAIDYAELNSIREKIESMPKFNQVEILRILHKDNQVTLNENKYGTFINLTDLSQNMIELLKTYINYVNTQEYNLNTLEKQKEEFKNIYFTKDNKDTTGNLNKIYA
uniref:NET domain-containing protein n=1 Tax=viral metagenome TaxID=1070528 RepID=A0A6C0B1J9_9ZZZZ